MTIDEISDILMPSERELYPVMVCISGQQGRGDTYYKITSLSIKKVFNSDKGEYEKVILLETFNL